MNFAQAYLQSTPLAILYPYELESKTNFLGELLQQIDAKSATALIKAPIPMCRLNIYSGTQNGSS